MHNIAVDKHTPSPNQSAHICYLQHKKSISQTKKAVIEEASHRCVKQKEKEKSAYVSSPHNLEGKDMNGSMILLPKATKNTHLQ